MLAALKVLLAVAFVGAGLPAGAQTRTGGINTGADAFPGASAAASPGSAWEIYDAGPELAADALLAARSYSAAELAAVNEVRGVSLARLQSAFEAGGAELNVGGRTIIIEPGMPASGMTLFGENGFVLGREAFTSNAELTKTLLHETHRLMTSQSAAGVTGSLATQETNAAFSFAERAFGEFFK